MYARCIDVFGVLTKIRLSQEFKEALQKNYTKQYLSNFTTREDWQILIKNKTAVNVHFISYEFSLYSNWTAGCSLTFCQTILLNKYLQSLLRCLLVPPTSYLVITWLNYARFNRNPKGILKTNIVQICVPASWRPFAPCRERGFGAWV